jgi:hypothetical protein
MRLYEEHRAAGTLPTNIRFLFYELVMRNELVTHDETWRIASDGLMQIDHILAQIGFPKSQSRTLKATS